MLKARDIMTKEIIFTHPEEDLETVIRMLLENKISGMPVCEGDRKIVGMISEVDIINFMFSGHMHNSKVKEAMSKNVISYPPDADIDTISLCMVEKKIRRVPVVENNKILGIISRRSIIKTLLNLLDKN